MNSWLSVLGTAVASATLIHFGHPELAVGIAWLVGRLTGKRDQFLKGKSA